MVLDLTPEQADDLVDVLEKSFEDQFDFALDEIGRWNSDVTTANLDFLDSIAAALECLGGDSELCSKYSLSILFSKANSSDAVKRSRLYERYMRM